MRDSAPPRRTAQTYSARTHPPEPSWGHVQRSTDPCVHAGPVVRIYAVLGRNRRSMRHCPTQTPCAAATPPYGLLAAGTLTRSAPPSPCTPSHPGRCIFRRPVLIDHPARHSPMTGCSAPAMYDPRQCARPSRGGQQWTLHMPCPLTRLYWYTLRPLAIQALHPSVVAVLAWSTAWHLPPCLH